MNKLANRISQAIRLFFYQKEEIISLRKKVIEQKKQLDYMQSVTGLLSEDVEVVGVAEKKESDYLRKENQRLFNRNMEYAGQLDKIRKDDDIIKSIIHTQEMISQCKDGLLGQKDETIQKLQSDISEIKNGGEIK